MISDVKIKKYIKRLKNRDLDFSTQKLIYLLGDIHKVHFRFSTHHALLRIITEVIPTHSFNLPKLITQLNEKEMNIIIQKAVL